MNLIILMILLKVFPVNLQKHEIKNPELFPFELERKQNLFCDPGNQY
jgi:hypothetical protein